ncbi:RNase H domain-containing protein [Trichonephila clavipes]|nr:RNase H domain-containing protein [Trichonephila clavipes]
MAYLHSIERTRCTRSEHCSCCYIACSIACCYIASILSNLKRPSTSHQIHLQWIPSREDLEGNEIADTLTKAGACEVPEQSAPFTVLEIFSGTKYQNKTTWIAPPEHHRYQCSRPGGSLAHGFKR